MVNKLETKTRKLKGSVELIDKQNISRNEIQAKTENSYQKFAKGKDDDRVLCNTSIVLEDL